MSENKPADEGPKFIVDDDWKSRAQAEKEALERAAHGSKPEQESHSASAGARAEGQRNAGDAPAAETAEESKSRPEGEGPASDQPAREPETLPPASFEILVTSIASQAMMTLEEAADPKSPERKTHLAHARFQVDLLGVLEEKTRGNLLPQEAALLENTLYQLRMAVVSVAKMS